MLESVCSDQIMFQPHHKVQQTKFLAIGYNNTLLLGGLRVFKALF